MLDLTPNIYNSLTPNSYDQTSHPVWQAAID